MQVISVKINKAIPVEKENHQVKINQKIVTVTYK